MYNMKIMKNSIYLVTEKVPDEMDEKLFALAIEGPNFSTKKQYWSSKNEETFLVSKGMYDLFNEEVTLRSYESDVLIETHEVSFSGKTIAITIPLNIHSGGFGDTFLILNVLRRFKEVYNCNIYISTEKMNDFFRSITDDFTFIDIFNNKKEDLGNLYVTNDNKVLTGIDYHFIPTVDHGDNIIRRLPYYQRWLNLFGIPLEQPLKPTLKEIPDIQETIPKPYICFSEFASMTSKQWHYENGWQELVDHFVGKGYTMVSISYEKSTLSNIFDLSGDYYSYLHRFGTLKNSEFYIGLDSGLSWMANFMDKYCFLIIGSVDEEFSFQDHVTRIGLPPDNYCRGCIEDTSILRSYDNLSNCWYRKDFECTRLLSTEMVINTIEGIQL